MQTKIVCVGLRAGRYGPKYDHDLLGIPDLSDNVIFFFLTFVSHLFGSTEFADFYINSVIFIIIIFFSLFDIKEYAVPANFLIRFANKRSSFNNRLFLILNWFLIFYI